MEPARPDEQALYVQLTPVGEGASIRFETHVALLASGEPISAWSWRSLPLSGIERIAPTFADVLTRPADRDPFSLSDVDAYFSTGVKLPVIYTPSAGPESRVTARTGDEPEPLQHPGGPITDDFLRRLAETYRWLTNASRAPAPVIAEQTGAPVGTVHRWIADARRRGFLPPGRKGKAG
jgi:hypothetical protein